LLEGIPKQSAGAQHQTARRHHGQMRGGGPATGAEAEQAEFEINVRSTYQQMVRISIEPQWARFYDFGAGRLPAFLANLVNDG